MVSASYPSHKEGRLLNWDKSNEIWVTNYKLSAYKDNPAVFVHEIRTDTDSPAIIAYLTYWWAYQEQLLCLMYTRCMVRGEERGVM